jgi:hypothetical protein
VFEQCLHKRIGAHLLQNVGLPDAAPQAVSMVECTKPVTNGRCSERIGMDEDDDKNSNNNDQQNDRIVLLIAISAVVVGLWLHIEPKNLIAGIIMASPFFLL